MSNEQPRRRWFHFTFREIVLLALAVGSGIGWLREFTISRPIRDIVGSVRENTWAGSARSSSRVGKFDGVEFEVSAGTPEWWATQVRPGSGIGSAEDAYLVSVRDSDDCTVRLGSTAEEVPARMDLRTLQAEHGVTFQALPGSKVRVIRHKPSRPVTIIWIEQAI